MIVIGDVLTEWAKRAPDVPFVQCGGSSWLTYSQLDEQSDRLAAGLQQVGVEKGDNVAVVLPNRMEYVNGFFALAKLGATQVPLNTYLRGEFLFYQLEDSQASTIITDTAGYSQVLPLLSRLSSLERIVFVDDVGHDVTPGLAVHSYADLMDSAAATLVRTAVRPTDLATILYTSGTTGLPKGCMISHGYYGAMAGAFREAGWIREGDRLLTAVQMFHTFGQVVSLAASLIAGASVSFEEQFHASTFMSRAREVDASIVFGVGAMGAALLARPDGAEDQDNQVRLALWVAMPAPMQSEFEKRFGVQVTAEIYGQTESIVVAITPAGTPNKPGTAGPPSPYFDVRIFDDDDDEVAQGEVGEIVVRPKRSNCMFSGYWNNPVATVGVSRNLWHHTGDYGKFDDEGYLIYVDRKKDAVRRRGVNVSSFEVEQALLRHEGIAAAAVHAVPSEMTEDDIKACIVPAADAKLTPQGLFEFFRSALPYFAIPRYVELLDELPTNVMGRPQKFKLRETSLTANTWDLEKMGLTVASKHRR